MFSVLIILMITLASQNVLSKVIIVNTSGGNESIACCIKGKCPCSSLSAALQHVESNTIINITSEEIELEGDIEIGSGNLKNITVTSDIFMSIICSSSEDTIHCDSCDDVTVSGIAWYNCSLALGNNSFMASCTLGANSTVTVMVSGSTRIERLMSGVGSLLQIYNAHDIGYVNLTISDSTLHSVDLDDDNCSAQWNLTIINSTFLGLVIYIPLYYDRVIHSFSICADVFYGMYMKNMTVMSLLHPISLDLSAMKGNITVSVSSSVFIDCSVMDIAIMRFVLTTHSEDSHTSVLISDTEFTHSKPALYLHTTANISSTFTLNDVNFTGNISQQYDNGLLILPNSRTIEVYMINVNFIANSYQAAVTQETAAVYINDRVSSYKLIFSHCNFINNTFTRGARLLYIDGYTEDDLFSNEIILDNCFIINNTVDYGQDMISRPGGGNIQILNSVFKYNTVDSAIISAGTIKSVTLNITGSKFVGNYAYLSCVYVPSLQTGHSDVLIVSSLFMHNDVGNCVSLTEADVFLVSSNFTDNSGSSIYLLKCGIYLRGNILFYNNTADKGAALYMDEGTTVSFGNGSVIHFFQNSALFGGAIFIDLSHGCQLINRIFFFSAELEYTEVTFKENFAGNNYNGDALYFRISKRCLVNTNTSDPTSLMYAPYHFNYSHLNSTNCCNISCSHLDTKFPAVTSPRYLILCGDNVRQLNDDVGRLDNVKYIISNGVLGKPVVFKGGVMDYFKKLTQNVQFNLFCDTCPSDIQLSGGHILVDNISPLNLTFFGDEINFNVNVTVSLTSFLDLYIQPIEAQVTVELEPCFIHLGYAYSKESNGCACYNVSVVKCNDHYNEIEDDYWIGNISSQPTTSLCPTRYCSFIHRKKFTLDYSELPDTVDAQCSDHRTGTACGQCSSGYTLAYDTTDCISENDCSTIITLVVIISTCLYWLIVVVGVFTLLYYNRRIPLGYTYGIIYYYSMVGILFSNNFYVSESAFLFISVLSSFTQLSPQFLGKLCLVKGLSGIDQLFIHYVHPVAVSLLVVAFVIAAKFSPKLSAFVSRCRIIRIICLLLLLSYTSIASTSLQLLRPLTFTDIPKLYTYTSPSIQYFHGRHALYGAVALVSELIVGIGLPLLLLLEPFVNSKINFVKIKPLLDEFQDCYKDKRKYRWFASYYLICRQVILLIVFIGNSNYNGMLFFLQITCIIIATIHMWARPYKSASLNIFDGLILQIMVVSVAINTSTFLQPAATELVLIVVIFPLFVMCAIGIREIIMRKLRGGEYTALLSDDARNDDDNDDFEESLLGFAAVNN